jgi:hypothetical protein
MPCQSHDASILRLRTAAKFAAYIAAVPVGKADIHEDAKLCSQLFDAYHCRHPGEISKVQLDALESQ